MERKIKCRRIDGSDNADCFSGEMMKLRVNDEVTREGRLHSSCLEFDKQTEILDMTNGNPRAQNVIG